MLYILKAMWHICYNRLLVLFKIPYIFSSEYRKYGFAQNFLNFHLSPQRVLWCLWPTYSIGVRELGADRFGEVFLDDLESRSNLTLSIVYHQTSFVIYKFNRSSLCAFLSQNVHHVLILLIHSDVCVSVISDIYIFYKTTILQPVQKIKNVSSSSTLVNRCKAGVILG